MECNICLNTGKFDFKPKKYPASSHQRVIVNRSINRNCEPSYTHFIVSKGKDEHEKLIKLRRKGFKLQTFLENFCKIG